VTAHLKVEIEGASPTACIVTLRGEHGRDTADAVAGVMRLASAYRDILVDLAECTFVDSSLIRTLLQAASQAHGRGGTLELVVARGQNPVRRTLETARIEDLLTFHPTRAAGVASFARRQRASVRPPSAGCSRKATDDVVQNESAAPQARPDANCDAPSVDAPPCDRDQH
jgi:anti-anti-sigma factor